tara:strand:+ start:214 stop:408 length:195 start_codon:yes stop_codon:yes gene_type:complete
LLDALKETMIQITTTMSPAFITTAMKIIIISMRRTMRQIMLNPIDTIVMMIRMNPRQTANDHLP